MSGRVPADVEEALATVLACLDNCNFCASITTCCESGPAALATIRAYVADSLLREGFASRPEHG